MKRRENRYWENRAQWSKIKTGTETSGTVGGTNQLLKPRPPPLWTGQKFDRWKIEVEK